MKKKNLFTTIFSFFTYRRTRDGRYVSLVEAFLKVIMNCPIPELRQDLGKSFLDVNRRQHAAGGAIHLNELIMAEGKEMFPHLKLVWD